MLCNSEAQHTHTNTGMLLLEFIHWEIDLSKVTLTHSASAGTRP